jgi:hypothetical protein
MTERIQVWSPLLGGHPIVFPPRSLIVRAHYPPAPIIFIASRERPEGIAKVEVTTPIDLQFTHAALRAASNRNTLASYASARRSRKSKFAFTTEKLSPSNC